MIATIDTAAIEAAGFTVATVRVYGTGCAYCAGRIEPGYPMAVRAAEFRQQTYHVTCAAKVAEIGA